MTTNQKSNNLLEKIEITAQKIQNNVYVSSISKGMMVTMPILILGALVTLARSIQFGPWQAFVTQPGVAMVLDALNMFTNGFFAVWVLLGISYRMGRNFKQEPISTIMVSLIAFLIINPVVGLEEGVFINSGALGTTGVFTAMVTAVIFSRIYVFLMDKKVYIRMPEMVPTFVERAFANIIPLVLVALLSGIILYLFSLTEYGSLPNFIFTMLQVPLTNLGGSYVGVSIAFMVISLLWWMGIHGKMIVYGAAFGAIFSINGIQNAEAVQAGAAGVNAFDMGSVRIFFEHGGAGCILALVALMLFAAKSEQYKSLGKVFSIPTFFGISEPAIFGTPIVLNFTFLIPMILAPFLSGTLGYIGVLTGILPMPGGITVPTGTPFFLDSIIIGGIPYLILQVLGFIVSIIVWYPFFRIADRTALLEEQANKEIIEEEVVVNPVPKVDTV